MTFFRQIALQNLQRKNFGFSETNYGGVDILTIPVLDCPLFSPEINLFKYEQRTHFLQIRCVFVVTGVTTEQLTTVYNYLKTNYRLNPFHVFVSEQLSTDGQA